jgi:DNA mismatch repair protein MutS
VSEPAGAVALRDQFPSLLFKEAPGTSEAREEAADRSFARDLNLDQIVSATARDREQRDLITRVLFTPLHDAGAVRYRQDVFRDLDDPALLGAARDYAGRMSAVGAHIRQLADMPYRHQSEGWLLDAASVCRHALHLTYGRLRERLTR